MAKWQQLQGICKPCRTSVARAGQVDSSTLRAIEGVMRLSFHNIDHAKRIAKSLARHTGAKLARCHEVLATTCGYRDWHEVSVITKSRSDAETVAGAPIDLQAKLIVEFGERLEADAGLVQFALSEAKAFQKTVVDPLLHQLQLRALCFRLTSIPDLGPRQPGSVGIVKPWKENVILRKYGNPTSIITNKHWNSIVADFEYTAPRTDIPLFIPMRLYVLYGAYIEADDSHVLYSRDYEPLWRIRKGKRPERFSGTQRIKHNSSIGFWDDTSTPWRNAKRYDEELERIRSYGITGLPWKVDWLPRYLNAPNIREA